MIDGELLTLRVSIWEVFKISLVLSLGALAEIWVSEISVLVVEAGQAHLQVRLCVSQSI